MSLLKFRGFATRFSFRSSRNAKSLRDGGGFITSGTGTRERSRSWADSLAQLGVPGALQGPIVNLNDANQHLIVSNDNWQQSRQLSLIEESGFQPGFSTEAAIVPTRPTGNITAVVTGKGGTTGVALVKVYYLP